MISFLSCISDALRAEDSVGSKEIAPLGLVNPTENRGLAPEWSFDM